MFKLCALFILLPLSSQANLADDINYLISECIDQRDILELSQGNEIYIYYLDGKIKAYREVLELSN